MIYRGLPASIRARLNSVAPQIRSSSAAQYGQQLLATSDFQKRISEIFANAPSQQGPAPTYTIGGGAATVGGYQPSLDPRMGYPGSWATIGGGAAGIAPYTGPVVNREPAWTIGGGAATISNPPTPRTYGGEQPWTQGARVNFKDSLIEEAESLAAQRQDLLEQAIAQMQAEMAGLEQMRKEALANAQGDIAEAYGKQIDEYNRQIGDANNQIAAWNDDLARWKAAVADTQAANQAGFANAADAAGTITEEGLPLIRGEGYKTAADIRQGYEEQLVEVGDALMNLNIDEESKAALTDSVMELSTLAQQERSLQSKGAQSILVAAEEVARTAALAAGATDEAEIKAIEEQWNKQLTDAITGLIKQREDIERARANANDEMARAMAEAKDAINGEFDTYGRFENQLDYAEQMTDRAMDAWFSTSGLDALDRAQIEGLFENLINSGVRDRRSAEAWLNAMIEDDQLPILDSSIEEGVYTMLDVFQGAMDNWSTLAQSAIPNQDVTGGSLRQKGDRIVYSRAGEAPNNKGNRGTPAYQQRAAFMGQMYSYIQTAFGVQPLGHWRALDASDTDSDQRSSNSDHYSGGALDFGGSQQNLDRLFNWLQQQPWVSFAQIYTSGDAAGTLHVSGLLDGVTHTVNDGHDHGQVAGTYTAPASGAGGKAV